MDLKSKVRAGDRRLALLAMVVVIVGAASMAWARPSEPKVQPPSVADERQADSVASDEDFSVSGFSWERPPNGAQGPVIRLDEGQDQRLIACGSDTWEESMLVLGDTGRAYCIYPLDTSDDEAVSSARILGMKLQGKDFNPAELAVLRLQVLSAAAAPGSPEAASYRAELEEAWATLSPAEKRNLAN